MFFIWYLEIGAVKNSEIVVEITRLLYLSNVSGITSIAILVCEILLSQVVVSVQTGTQNRFGLALFLTMCIRIYKSDLNKSCS